MKKFNPNKVVFTMSVFKNTWYAEIESNENDLAKCETLIEIGFVENYDVENRQAVHKHCKNREHVIEIFKQLGATKYRSWVPGYWSINNV